MTARTLMNSQPVVLRPTDTVATATAHILKHHLRHLPVIDEGVAILARSAFKRCA